MPLEAEIISVSKPGESVDVVVEFKKNGRVLSRETIPFSPNERLDTAILRAKINLKGASLDRSDDAEAFARGVIGQKFPVEAVPEVPVTPIGETRSIKP